MPKQRLQIMDLAKIPKTDKTQVDGNTNANSKKTLSDNLSENIQSLCASSESLL
jgi:hypothetical protein